MVRLDAPLGGGDHEGGADGDAAVAVGHAGGESVRGAELGYPDEHHLDAVVGERDDAAAILRRMLDFFSPSSTFTASRVPAGPHDPAWIIFTSVMAMWRGKRGERRVCDEGAQSGAARGE